MKIGSNGFVEWTLVIGDGIGDDQCWGVGQSLDGQWLYFAGTTQGLNTPN